VSGGPAVRNADLISRLMVSFEDIRTGKLERRLYIFRTLQ